MALKNLYNVLKAHRKRIEDLERRIKMLEARAESVDAIAKQTVESALAFGVPSIPYNDKHYEIEPDACQTNGEKLDDRLI